MSDTQIKTLEDFKKERALEWGYKSWSDMMNSGIVISNKVFEELEVYKRFHAYQLECKDKEIEEVAFSNKVLVSMCNQLADELSVFLLLENKEIAELKQMVVNESKEIAQKDASLKASIEHLEGLLDEKIKEIEELKKEVPQWISIEERLPENGTTVIATDGLKARVSWYGKRTINDTPYFVYVNFNSTVTHRMPLPQPPNQN